MNDAEAMEQLCSELEALSELVLARVGFLFRANTEVTVEDMAHALCLAAGRLGLGSMCDEHLPEFMEALCVSLTAPIGLEVKVTNPEAPQIVVLH